MEDNKYGFIVTSNDLIQAKYQFSLWQKRIFMYFVSCIEKDTQEFRLQRAYIADLIRYFEAAPNGKIYNLIANIPEQLFEAAIEIPYITEEGYKRYGAIRVITKYTKPSNMEPGNSYIEFRFNDDLKPHLLELKRRFTKYDLKNIIHLQSIYSIRIFEILKSYEYKKIVDLDVDYLKDLLEITIKYRFYGDFKRFVLDKAQEDLLEHCDIAFNYKEIKKGRRIFTIRFTIFKNEKNYKESTQILAADRFEQPISVAEPQPIIQKTPKPPKVEKKETIAPNTPTENPNTESLYTEFEADVIKSFGVTPFVLVKLIENYDAELIRKQIRITKRKRGSSPTTNIAGFFVNAVKTDYNDPEEAREAKKQANLEAKRKAQQAQIEAQQREAKRKEHIEERKETVAMISKSVNNTIRKLIAKDPTVTARAIAYATQQISTDSTLRTVFDQLGYQFEQLNLEIWRKEPFLCQQVIEAMQKIEPQAFVYLSSLLEELEELELEIKSLPQPLQRRGVS